MIDTIIKAAVTGFIVGIVLFIGLGIFAGRVFEDHTKMFEQMKDQHQALKIELQLLQIKQVETNARVIEMRQLCK